MTDAITIQNPRNRGGSTGHVLAKRSVTFTEIRSKAQNKRIASPRARVEHVFASLAQMGGKIIRSIGLARTQFGLIVKSAVYNLKRMSSLLEMT